MQKVGFGTFGIENGKPTTQAVLDAIHTGYRHIDTAVSYGNDFAVGKALKKCEIPREELHITGKLWCSAKTKEEVVEQGKRTLKMLKLEYLDEYLVHWPFSKSREENWKVMNGDIWLGLEQLYKEGYVKCIGTSNFTIEHLEALKDTATVFPMVNQIEFHPGKYQRQLLTYCKQNDMIIEAWSPLGAGAVLQNDTIMELSQKYRVSSAAICLNFCIAHDTVPIVRSTNPIRMAENLSSWKFHMESQDMERLEALVNVGDTGLDPDDKDLFRKLEEYGK